MMTPKIFNEHDLAAGMNVGVTCSADIPSGAFVLGWTRPPSSRSKTVVSMDADWNQGAVVNCGAKTPCYVCSLECIGKVCKCAVVEIPSPTGNSASHFQASGGSSVSAAQRPIVDLRISWTESSFVLRSNGAELCGVVEHPCETCLELDDTDIQSRQEQETANQRVRGAVHSGRRCKNSSG